MGIKKREALMKMTSSDKFRKSVESKVYNVLANKALIIGIIYLVAIIKLIVDNTVLNRKLKKYQ